MKLEEDFYIAESDLTPSMKVVRFYFHRVSPLTPRLATRLFWHLFTQPRPRKFSSVDERFYATAKSSHYRSEEFGVPFSMHEKGSGEQKVLILHGWEGRSSDFSKLISELEKDATVISLDFPGHGKSSKSRAHLPIFMDVIKTAIDEIKDVDTIIGHSLGAASLAMTFGKYDLKAQAKQLIFLGLHPEPSQYFLQYKKVTKINENIFQRCVKLAQRKTGAKLLDYSCYNYLDKYQDFDIHFVHDKNDKIINVKRVEELSDNLSNSRVFKGDHGGHFRHYKNDEVIQEISKIIQKK